MIVYYGTNIRMSTEFADGVRAFEPLSVRDEPMDNAGPLFLVMNRTYVMLIRTDQGVLPEIVRGDRGYLLPRE